jgi:hypothetical protein
MHYSTKKEEEIFISSYHWFENLVMMVKWNCRLCVDEDLKLYKVCVVTGETTNTIHQLGMISRAQVTGWCQTP